MKMSALASGLLTVGIVIYLVLTEWQFGNKPVERPREKPALPSKVDSQDRKPKVDNKSSSRSNQPAKKPAAAQTGQSGARVYWIDKRCDCPRGYAVMLEAVEIDDKHTTLSFLNARNGQISTYPAGHEAAQFLLESRVVGSGKPRHNLKAASGIAFHPKFSTGRNFKFVFPRIADAAKTIQLTGNSTPDLAALHYTGIKLENEMSADDWKRLTSYKQCGFDGSSAVRVGQTASYAAHRHPGGNRYRWTATSGLIMTSRSSEATLNVRGSRPGTSELCLTGDRDGSPCTSCQKIEVRTGGDEQAPDPDFTMSGCSGFPSRDPHWRFAIGNPIDKTLYQWNVTGHARIIRNSQTDNPVVVKPTLRPGKFTVTVTATYSSGKTAAQTQELHNVYSCPQPFG